MTDKAKTEALEMIRAAEKGCSKVHEAWSSAHEALHANVSINGYGVYHDKGERLRSMLQKAQSQIAIALAGLDGIRWPTDADYDDAE
ncbi:hypothetical protein D3C80_121550 [compost metagenome]